MVVLFQWTISFLLRICVWEKLTLILNRFEENTGRACVQRQGHAERQDKGHTSVYPWKNGPAPSSPTVKGLQLANSRQKTVETQAMPDNFDVDRAGILLRKSVNFFDLRTKLRVMFGGPSCGKSTSPGISILVDGTYKANKRLLSLWPPDPISHVCSLSGKYICRKCFPDRSVQNLKSCSGDFCSPESDPPHKIMRYWFYY